MPQGRLTAVAELDSATNPKTLWWGWAQDIPADEVQDQLEAMTSQTEWAGRIDFRTKLKLGTPGEQVREELEVAKKMTDGGLFFNHESIGE